MDSPLLTLRDVTVAYKTRSGDVHAANDISLDLYSADALGIVGESGSGKSTLVMGILNLLGENARICTADSSSPFTDRCR